MKYIISVSSYGLSPRDFQAQLQSFYGDNVEIHSLNWQLQGGPQKLLDYLDTRDGQKVIVDVANELIECFEEALSTGKDIVIISQKAGSRIVEEALAMVKGMEKLHSRMEHIMLAPQIGGSDWKSIGKYAASVLMMGAAGIAAIASNSKKGKAAALLGALGSVALSKQETISDKIRISEETPESDDKINFTNIRRTILYNPEDASFDLLTQNLSEGKFYKGIYPIEEIISLDEIHLNQEFQRSKWLGTESKTKRDILSLN